MECCMLIFPLPLPTEAYVSRQVGPAGGNAKERDHIRDNDIPLDTSIHAIWPGSLLVAPVPLPSSHSIAFVGSAEEGCGPHNAKILVRRKSVGMSQVFWQKVDPPDRGNT